MGDRVILEVWKDIQGYEGLYQISNKGRVKSLDRTTTRKNGKRMHYGEKNTEIYTKFHGIS